MTETTDADPTLEERTADRERTDAAANTDGDARPGSGNGGWAGLGRRSVYETVQLALLVLLLLVVAVATLRFYFSASAAVDRFVTSQYRPLFQAGFNLAVLLAASVGVSILLRRLS